MVLEHVLLPVAPDRRDAFEATFAQALPLISATPGFEEGRLSFSRICSDGCRPAAARARVLTPCNV